jgi:hypothetical protein
VLTTFNVLEMEYRKNVLPNKKACQYCDKKYYPQQLKLHLTFWCGPDAKRSAAQSKTQIKKGGKGKGKQAGESGSKGKAMEEEEEQEAPEEAQDEGVSETEDEEEVKRPARTLLILCVSKGLQNRLLRSPYSHLTLPRRHAGGGRPQGQRQGQTRGGQRRGQGRRGRGRGGGEHRQGAAEGVAKAVPRGDEGRRAGDGAGRGRAAAGDAGLHEERAAPLPLASHHPGRGERPTKGECSAC